MNEEEKKEAEQKAEKETNNKAATIAAEKARAEKEQADNTKRIDEGVAELKKQNEEKAKLVEREEKLQDRKEALHALGGGSPGGDKPTPESEDEEWAKGAKERYAGTGMSPVEDDDGK